MARSTNGIPVFARKREGGEKTMLNKKEIVQKSFRIDKNTDNKLKQLSVILNRRENELVNIALKSLIEEHKMLLVGDFQGYQYQED